MWHAARWLEVRDLRRKAKIGPKKGTQWDCRAELVIEEPSVWAQTAPYLRSYPKVNRWSTEESSKVGKNMTERASQSKFYLPLAYEERLGECGRV